MTQTETQAWVLAAHLGPLILGFIAPLVVMLVVDQRSAFARRQAVEALNFQLSFLIYFIVSALLMILLVGFLLIAVVGVLWLVFMVIAAIQSSGGNDYRYPLTFAFIS
jgi:uncharacterized protein